MSGGSGGSGDAKAAVTAMAAKTPMSLTKSNHSSKHSEKHSEKQSEGNEAGKNFKGYSFCLCSLQSKTIPLKIYCPNLHAFTVEEFKPSMKLFDPELPLVDVGTGCGCSIIKLLLQMETQPEIVIGLEWHETQHTPCQFMDLEAKKMESHPCLIPHYDKDRTMISKILSFQRDLAMVLCYPYLDPKDDLEVIFQLKPKQLFIYLQGFYEEEHQISPTSGSDELLSVLMNPFLESIHFKSQNQTRQESKSAFLIGTTSYRFQLTQMVEKKEGMSECMPKEEFDALPSYSRSLWGLFMFLERVDEKPTVVNSKVAPHFSLKKSS